MSKELEARLAKLEEENAKHKAKIEDLEEENEALRKSKGTPKNEGRDKFKVTKGAKVDFEIEVEATEKDGYHDAGVKFKTGEANARRLEKEGKVKVIGKYVGKVALLLVFLFAGLFAQAQILSASQVKISSGQYLMNLENTLGTNLTRDTTTNTGTGVLVTDRAIVGPGEVTIVALVTKVSGTVAGTLVLTGSIDGTNYQTINQPNTQTAVVTVAAVSDATARYSFSLNTNPFRYYKVTHTGTGTMVSYLDAAILKH